MQNKKELQKELGLPVNNDPIIGVVHRLVSQKGLDLVVETFEEMMAMGIQFVLLGIGDPHLEDTFTRLMEKYPDRVSVRIEFNEVLAHKIYAGSDIFLMPSRFEPCGLGQMISLRYGTIPVVRETGGLKDTIIDIDRDPEKEMDSASVNIPPRPSLTRLAGPLMYTGIIRGFGLI